MATKQSLKGIIKQCANCERMLSGRCFTYNQHSPDKLRDYCRTCDSYKPKGHPTLSAVLHFEEQMQNIIREAQESIDDPLKNRIKFESYVYSEMSRLGLLDTWKPPVWIHKTSIKAI